MDYKQKYFKYKQKYLNLLNSLPGEPSPEPELRALMPNFINTDENKKAYIRNGGGYTIPEEYRYIEKPIAMEQIHRLYEKMQEYQQFPGLALTFKFPNIQLSDAFIELDDLQEGILNKLSPMIPGKDNKITIPQFIYDNVKLLTIRGFLYYQSKKRKVYRFSLVEPSIKPEYISLPEILEKVPKLEQLEFKVSEVEHLNKAMKKHLKNLKRLYIFLRDVSSEINHLQPGIFDNLETLELGGKLDTSLVVYDFLTKSKFPKLRKLILCPYKELKITTELDKLIKLEELLLGASFKQPEAELIALLNKLPNLKQLTLPANYPKITSPRDSLSIEYVDFYLLLDD